MPFQPKKFNAFARNIIILPMMSKKFPKMVNGQVPKNTTKTIIKIVNKIFFIL